MTSRLIPLDHSPTPVTLGANNSLRPQSEGISLHNPINLFNSNEKQDCYSSMYERMLRYSEKNP